MPTRIARRSFLSLPIMVAAGSAVRGADPAAPRILLRSSWQTINIGDIAHTPGMLALLERHLPAAEVTLWPNTLSEPVIAMLRARFPRLRLALAAADQEAAIQDCDFCLHGSGPGLVGAAQLRRWQATGKPYGFGGVTLNDTELEKERELLAGARFVYCRDTLSLEALRASGIDGPRMEFAPDATFFLDLRNETPVESFLREHRLEAKQFACFVPRLRYTPYWQEGRKVPPEQKAERQQVNETYREPDHAKMREAIVAWVREARLPALLCPEMTYQVELLKPLLWDPLPEDVRSRVVIRPGYWLTDEAASTYARAAAVVSFEMHSPIIALAAGTPAIHLRQPTDTRKGQMWRDVGLGDWIFEIEETRGEQIAARLLQLFQNPERTRSQVQKARQFAADRGQQMMQSVQTHLAR
jgi:polysaccharide pyruvyl transferase WcaK-like protein